MSVGSRGAQPFRTQEQHSWVRCKLHPDVHPLALAAADASHPLVPDLGVPDLIPAQQLQRLVHQLQLDGCLEGGRGREVKAGKPEWQRSQTDGMQRAALCCHD